MMLKPFGFNRADTSGGFSDDFNRANENLDASANYSVIFGQLVVSSNRVQVSDPSSEFEGAVVIDATGAQSADFTWSADATFDTADAASAVSLGFRRNSSGHFFSLQLDASGDLYLSLFDPGYSAVTEALGLTLNATGVANTIELVCSGTSIIASVNGSEAINTTSSTLQTEQGKRFLVANSSQASSTSQDTYLDNFVIS